MTQTVETFQVWDEDGAPHGTDAALRLQAPDTRDIIKQLNTNFQFVANWLPSHVKLGIPDRRKDLCSVAGAGVLWGMYLGSRPSYSAEYILEFVVKVGMDFDGPDRLGLAKDFGLTYQTHEHPGPLVDLDPIRLQEVTGLGDRVGEVAFAAHSLQREFSHLYVPEQHR